MAPRETENNAYAKFGVTNKEHYGMLWYFLEWSIARWPQPLSRGLISHFSDNHFRTSITGRLIEV